MKKVIRFFDLLEDKVRARLSRHPVVYGIVSGLGIVMFYRGVWMVLDDMPIMTGPITLIASTVILLISGVFVSQFVSNHIILSGIKKEKKMTEKLEEELKSDTEINREILDSLKKIQISIDKALLAKDEKTS